MNPIDRMVLLVVVLVGVLVIDARLARADAEGERTVWVNAGGLSWHSDRTSAFNERNAGLGVQYVHDAAWAGAAGAFRNSEHATSRYLLARYTPWHWRTPLGTAKLGAVAGLIDGYSHDVQPGNGRATKWGQGGDPLLMAAPVLALEGPRLGVQAVVVPPVYGRTWVVAVSVQLRVW